jgi:hypothetical protein
MVKRSSEILTTLLPNYVYKSKGTLLEQENKKSS